MVMVSLYSNRNPITEVGIRVCGIALTALTMLLFEEIWTLELWIRKQWKALSAANGPP